MKLEAKKYLYDNLGQATTNSGEHKGTLLNYWNNLDRRILNSGRSTTSPTFSSRRRRRIRVRSMPNLSSANEKSDDMTKMTRERLGCAEDQRSAKETEPRDLVDHQVKDYRAVERQEHSFT